MINTQAFEETFNVSDSRNDANSDSMMPNASYLAVRALNTTISYCYVLQGLGVEVCLCVLHGCQEAPISLAAGLYLELYYWTEEGFSS